MQRIIRKNLLITYISIISIVFFIAIAFDITPYLRGPVDSFLKSRWPYYYVNTWNKVWFPTVIFACLLLLYHTVSLYYKDFTRKKEYIFLTILVILVFSLQLSLVYFSRFGMTILFQRITNPGMNGYFSSAVKTKDVNSLLRNFPTTAHTLDQHAKDHPPGSVLLLKGTITFFEDSPKVTNFLLRFIRKPARKDASKLWSQLSQSQRVAAVFSAFLFHLFAATTIIPFYFLAKNVFDKRVAIYGTLLYAIIPSLSFFALIFDPFYTLFSLTSFLVFMLGFNKQRYALLFLSGAIFCLGLFFSLSLQPILGIIYLYALLSFIKTRDKEIIKSMCFFTAGIVCLIGVLYVLGFNFIKAVPAIIGNQAPRMYVPWLFFNPYDFFVFLGIPISLLFLFITAKEFKKPKVLIQNSSFLLPSFWIVFILLIISGISRGEVGRIWLPLMFIPVLLVASYITNTLKFSQRQFFIILLLVFTQVIIMEEFWVPVW